MTAIEMNATTIKKMNPSMQSIGFYSVEFAVDDPHPLYQFKIWRDESRSMFVVVKENSAVLPKLKAGSVLNMTYYSSDAQCPKTQLETRIESINNAHRGRFEGHCIVDLLPIDMAAN